MTQTLTTHNDTAEALPTQVALSSLLQVFRLGETPIPGYEDGDQDRLCDQDRLFCLGQIEARYVDRSHERGVKSWIRADQKVYRQLKPKFDEWVKSIDAWTALIQPYLPHYNPWDGTYGGASIADMVITLGELGLIAWDVDVPVASTKAVIDFIYSHHSDCDAPTLLARTAFKAGRLDILKATELIRSDYMTPTAYWQEQIQNHHGTSSLNWLELSQYESCRALHPTIALLATLEIPANVAGALRSMGLTLNPDGTERSGHYNHQNIFAWTYSMQRGMQRMVSGFTGVVLNTDDLDHLSYQDVMNHRDFIDWHELMLQQIGEAHLRQLYDLFGIDWAVIEDILQTLPATWWTLLGVNPKVLPSAKVLRDLYIQRMKLIHPDRQGSTTATQDLNAAYEIAKEKIAPQRTRR